MNYKFLLTLLFFNVCLNIGFKIGLYDKNKKNKKIAMGYKVIKKEVNQFIGEIEVNDFIHDFETIIENNSNEDVNIKSMTIIVK